MKIKMHALYDHFPDLTPQEGDDYINCYADMHLMDCKEPGRNFAMLLEPKSMIKEAYDYAAKHPEYFKYIFTHDSDLLELPNAKPFFWCEVWLQTDSIKDKGISLCTSYKNWCPLHHARLELANYYNGRNDVDVFYGNWETPQTPTVKPQDYLEHYKFSIIIENDIDDYWFTEKILNCFATKTVPIYTGAKKIYCLFNDDGIIRVDNWKDIPRIIEHLDLGQAYNSRLEAIEDNYKRIDSYKINWKDRFFRDYGDLLEGI